MLPAGTLCHGAVVGLAWAGGPGVFAQPVVRAPSDASQLQIVLGTSLAEGLAALIRPPVDADAEAEARLIEAFQLGALTELDRPDGPARLDALLHATGFASLPGPVEHEAIDQPPTPVPGTPPLHPIAPLPGIFGVSRTPVASQPHDPALVDGADGLGVDARLAAPAAVGAADVGDHAPAIAAGGLAEVVRQLDLPAAARRAEWTSVNAARSTPRFYSPADPVVLIQGARRSFKHGGDGRFTERGTLACRVTGSWVFALALRDDTTVNAATVARALPAEVDHPALPPECGGLLIELVLLDPGSAVALEHAATGAADPVRVKHLAAEQTAWWALRDSTVPAARFQTASAVRGTLPSPIAVALPAAPWNPLRLEWELEVAPSRRGIADWHLDEVDFIVAAASATPASAITIQGTTLLTGGVTDIASGSVRSAQDAVARIGGDGDVLPGQIDRHGSDVAGAFDALVEDLNQQIASGGAQPDSDRLLDLAEVISRMDVIGGALDGMGAQLRARLPPETRTLRAGSFRMIRSRLVDTFGQVVELDPSRTIIAPSLSVPGRPGVMALPPRLTAPARVLLRWSDAHNPAPPGVTMTPVAGFVLPDNFDGALELFAGDGAALGSVGPTPTGEVGWEPPPGRSATLAAAPPADANPNLVAFVEGLRRWGLNDAGHSAETALGALLRIIDSTRWTVDPFAQAGRDELRLLVGHPIVVACATLRLELRETDPTTRSELVRVPVRLGSLAHWQDGLFGFFLDDDYQALHVAPAAAELALPLGPGRGYLQRIDDVPAFDAEVAAAPAGQGVRHTYLDTSGTVWLQPGVERRLTLLLKPHGLVYVTAGVVPRKEIGLRRDWIEPGLRALSPTFRVGPVLVDPRTIRMPVPVGVAETWRWRHRADAASWIDDPVVRATADAHLDPVEAMEGWLRLDLLDPEGG